MVPQLRPAEHTLGGARRARVHDGRGAQAELAAAAHRQRACGRTFLPFTPTIRRPRTTKGEALEEMAEADLGREGAAGGRPADSGAGALHAHGCDAGHGMAWHHGALTRPHAAQAAEHRRGAPARPLPALCLQGRRTLFTRRRRGGSWRSCWAVVAPWRWCHGWVTCSPPRPKPSVCGCLLPRFLADHATCSRSMSDVRCCVHASGASLVIHGRHACRVRWIAVPRRSVHGRSTRLSGELLPLPV